MTVQGSTICSLVQTFPILLILAQNHNRCLKTPLIYKPPTPTPSPEYYEALEALFQNIYGHGAHGHKEPHGCTTYGYGYGGGYGYSKKHSHSTNPCYTYTYPGHDLSHHGHASYPTIPQPSYPTVYHGYNAYPSYGTYGYKKVSAYNLSGVQGYKGTYAPTQVYNLNHKYKVVVKKNKRRRPHKLQSVSKIAKPKDHDLQSESPDNGTIILQQIGIQPTPALVEEMNHDGLNETKSDPSYSEAVDISVQLQP